MPEITVHDGTLDPDLADEVLNLSTEAFVTDKVTALSEASRLALSGDSPSGTRHLTAFEGDWLVGYAQVWPDDSAELVVTPDRRRHGIGTALWEAAVGAGAQRVWAHGDLEPARAFGTAAGLEPIRSLLKMGRPLTDEDRTPRHLPEGYAVTTFAAAAPQTTGQVGVAESGADAAASDGLLAQVQAVNAVAFAHHPEQGRLTVEDFRTRMGEPWFDPAGLILVLDEEDRERGPIAFHWTKIEPCAHTGEVYVVGIDPDYQGRGLAGPLTDLGLAHLVESGCTAVELYVDGENTAARRTYERAGLAVLTTDVVWGRIES